MLAALPLTAQPVGSTGMPAVRRASGRFLLAATFVVLVFALPFAARAQAEVSERVYVVAAGDTLSRIAARLGVSPRALAARNGLQPPYRLRVGRRLRLPEGVDPAVLRRLPLRTQQGSGSASTALSSLTGRSDEAAPSVHRPGFVTLVRQRDGAVLATNFLAGTQALRVRVERFLRFRDGSRHAIHPRLMRAIAAVSDHFGGRRMVVLSGFRPQLRDLRRPRSTHSRGNAVDIRVEGVSLRALYAFCQTLESTGCGLYPRGHYVHLDVRIESAAWTDGSDAGQRPTRRDAEESVSEVLADAAPLRPGVLRVSAP